MSTPPTAPPSRTRKLVILAALVAAAGVGAWLLFGQDQEAARTRGLGDYVFEDPARVYYGNPDLARHAASVDSSRVFAQIAEYQQIQREGLGDSTPKYHLLLEKASSRFRAAVNAAARAQQVDAVAEAGTIRVRRPGAPPPADLTDQAIARLQ